MRVIVASKAGSSLVFGISISENNIVCKDISLNVEIISAV